MLVKNASAGADLLHDGLRAAGVHVTVVATVFDLPAEMERAGGVPYLVLGVDYFGREEFRLLPMVRREWPRTVIVAYHGPGFEHQGRVAELVGADVVLGSPADVSRFVTGLAGPLGAADASSAAGERAAAPASAAGPEPEPAAPNAPDGPAAPAEASRPKPPAPPAGNNLKQGALPLPDGPADDTTPAEPDAAGTIKVTEEELRLLLGEDEEAPPGP